MGENSMSLNIDQFQEPNDGPVGLIKSPTKDSADNLILFSAVAVRLGLKSNAWFVVNVLGTRTIEPGCYNRRTNEPNLPSAHDDHWGASCVNEAVAVDVFNFGRKHYWIWGDWKKLSNNFWRFVWFKPIIKAAKRVNLSWLDKKRIGFGLWWNFHGPVRIDKKWYLGDPRKETSGRQLFWLALPHIDELPSAKKWVENMSNLYGVNWLYEMFKIYYGEEHIFTQMEKSK
jgi:hypothetical protein